MFCYQCEQTAGGKGCTKQGVCGKTPETAGLQDLAIHVAKGLARYQTRLRKLGIVDRQADVFILELIFLTVTNVNFDPDAIEAMLRRAQEIGQGLRDKYEHACEASGQTPEILCTEKCKLANSRSGLIEQAKQLEIDKRKEDDGEDIVALQELIMYGIKGAAAYADHAQILGHIDDEISGEFMEILDYLATNPKDVPELVATALRTGELNLKVMALLDKANTESYGHPEPTQVRITPVPGKCILISGHDLKDLAALLEQTKDTGINVYTHGEMLPCHAYPELNKYPHLAGNYGGAWQDQQREFDEFPGPIVMTTNCIMPPRDTYKDRIYTLGVVGFPGTHHIDGYDFSPIIEAANNCPGFTEETEPQFITVGFGHNAVINVAETVINAVKEGHIKHFFLVGGCDGAKPGRNYYTEFAEQVPDDCVILTLACGKYRFNKMEFGDIGGIPRLLDIGQCNDAYSAIQIAVALANAFECEVNDLPLSMILSWYEQKAVAILLTLLHLGIKDIKIGPSLPAFVTPTILNVLVENFNISPVTEAKKDLESILQPS